jgi:putative Mg2+ transporter-C (MgtC) family protein
MDSFDQSIHFWLQLTGWTGEAVFKLLVAAIAGGLVGLERELRGREAGFRTNLLVCLGSALVMIVSIRFATTPWMPESAYNINIDPGRIAYGVMTGIGFVCAGAILKHESSVRGLTTAAGLWCVAAIGLAAGFGMYTLAILAAVLVLAALWGLNSIEKRVPRRRFRRLTVRTPWRENCLDDLKKRCETEGIEIVDLSYERKGDLSQVDVKLLLSFADKEDHRTLEERLHADTECTLLASERA